MMSFQKIYSPTQLANAMKLVRQQNGWTQSELAKKIGIKQATISNFENNHTVVSEIWGLVVVNEHDNHDRQRLDSSLVYTGAHNVYYVKSCLSDAKCFSGSRYSFRVQELKPLLFHNWPVHGEIAWLFPAPC